MNEGFGFNVTTTDLLGKQMTHFVLICKLNNYFSHHKSFFKFKCVEDFFKPVIFTFILLFV